MKNTLIDYHIHTVYSGHSTPDMTVRSIVERAELLGLESIVILEHAFYSSMGRVCLEQIKKEVNYIESGVNILVGMEIDPDYTRKGKLIFDDFNRNELDIVLVGTHTIPGIGKGWHIELELTQKEKERVYHTWFEMMEAVLEDLPVDIIAHPGRLISRNGIIEKFRGKVLKDFEHLFSIAKKKDVAFELNESLLKMFQNENLLQPYTEIVRLALSIGLKISLGSDAHSLDRIGEKFYITEAIHQCNILQENLFIIRGGV
ncbi:MAG TPA: PHP domain-containing protein [bacterium]|nr:PHP domain-containing protein [bacterium]